MRALVTGATGFIGGALAQALAETGWQVAVLVRPGGSNRLPHGHAYEVFEADLSQVVDSEHARQLAQAVDGCEVVFHAAAIRDRWGTSLEAYRQVNVTATRALLAASRGRVGRFVYVSSVGVLGHPGVLGIDETFPISSQEGKTGYHNTKAEAERLALSAAGLEPVVVRPTITYGPGDADGMLTRLIAMLAKRRYLQIGRGNNHFHLTYIDDLVDGLLRAATSPHAVGETFILAGPRSITVREIVALIRQALGQKPGALSRFYLPEALARPLAWGVELAYRGAAGLGLVSPQTTPFVTRDKIDTICIHRGFSAAKAGRLLGYSPRVDYPEGIDRTLAWMRSAGLLPQTTPRLPVESAAQSRSPHSSEVR